MLLYILKIFKNLTDFIYNNIKKTNSQKKLNICSVFFL